MRSKIIFLLLFMFSFVIVHDTVIQVIDNEKPPTTLSSISKSSCMTHTSGMDVNTLHAMFHFVALVTPDALHTAAPLKTRRLFFSLLKPSLPHEETSYKPPIV